MARMAIFGLSVEAERLLAMLLELPLVLPDHVEDCEGSPSRLRVKMHRLRRRLEAHGIKLHSKRNVGYWLDGLSKRRLGQLTVERLHQRRVASDIGCEAKQRIEG